MMVTGQLTIDADVLGRVYLRLGTAARAFRPDAHAWFVEACVRIDVRSADIAWQWNALAMVTAVTAVPPERVGDADFELGSTAVIDAYVARGKPESGRNMASIFHRLRLTLFHAGRLDSHRRPPRRSPVSVTGWAVVAPGFPENARRYVAQVELSLRPATTKHIETDLREFGTWLATAHPEVASCADLERRHI
jgi:integrase/recombinase XerD